MVGNLNSRSWVSDTNFLINNILGSWETLYRLYNWNRVHCMSVITLKFSDNSLSINENNIVRVFKISSWIWYIGLKKIK